MKLPRRFVTKLRLATVLAASAALGWSAPEARAGLVLSSPVVTTDVTGEGDTLVDRLPAPRVFATTILSGTAEARMSYDFVVDGPPGEFIPVVVTSTLSYSASETNSLSAWIAQAAVGISGGQSGGQFEQIINRSDLPVFSKDVVFIDGVISQTLVQVNISAFVADFIVAGTHPPNSLISAKADPVISFAPGFDSTGFTIVLPPGVGNSFDSGSATPEPSTLVLSSITFGMWGVVWAYRQRKRTRAAA